MRISRPGACVMAVLGLVLVVAVAPAGAQVSEGIALEMTIGDLAVTHSCLEPPAALTLRVRIEPPGQTTTCTLPCGVVTGGPGSLAAGVVDLAFDPRTLRVQQLTSNPGTAARDGLAQMQNQASGRVGWALAGDWVVDGDTASGLESPCSMGLLSGPSWLFEVQLEPLPGAFGLTSIGFRRQESADPFELSFSDLCQEGTWTPGDGGVTGLVGLSVLIAPDCGAAVFFDGFETSGVTTWSVTVGGP